MIKIKDSLLNLKYSIGEQVYYCERLDDENFTIYLAKIISLFPMLDCNLVYEIIYEYYIIKEEIDGDKCVCEMKLIKVPGVHEQCLFKEQYDALKYCYTESEKDK